MFSLINIIHKKIFYSAGAAILLAGIFVSGYFVKRSSQMNTPHNKYSHVVSKKTTYKQLTSEKSSLPQKTELLSGGIVGFIVPKAEQSKYSQIKVMDKSGKTVTVDATKQPIFVMAYWDDHSVNVLKTFAKFHIKAPVIVSVDFKPGVSFDSGVKLTQEQITSSDLKDPAIYYNQNGIEALNAYPMTVLQYKGQIAEVIGDFPSIDNLGKILGNE